MVAAVGGSPVERTLGKTATRITTGSELRDEISVAPLSGIG
jgi:hypothetical protein